VIHCQSSAELFHTSEELEYIVRESQEGGLLRRESAQVLQELFKFGDLIREVMAPRVRINALPKTAATSAIEAILRSSPHTRYLVYETNLDHIIGMVPHQGYSEEISQSPSGQRRAGSSCS